MELLEDDGWGAQEKWDGKRLTLKAERTPTGGLDISAGNKQGMLSDFPTTYAVALSDYRKDLLVLDGESIGDIYHVFDILNEAGNDLQCKEYDERHRILAVCWIPSRAARSGW